MTQATLSASTQEKAPVRRYLTPDQELALIVQVQERTQLLQSKTACLTLDEHRIRIQGERAFNRLVEDYKGTIYRLIHRYRFLNRITFDEMYQIALVAFEKAVSSFNPKCPGKQRKFSSWAFLKITSKYISLYRSELVYSRKVRSAYEGARATDKPSEYQPPAPLPQANLKQIIVQEIEASLPMSDAQILKDFYINRYSMKVIALNFGYSTEVLNKCKRQSLRKLRTNPRLQELAEEYIA